MEGQKRHNRHRNTYLLLIGAGLFLLLDKMLGASTVIAVFMVLLGLYAVRSGIGKRGYLLLGIGLLLIMGNNFAIVLALILLSLGFFYLKARDYQGEGPYIQKHKLIESLKWDREPWVLRSMSLWYVIGELNLDLTLAIPEEQEATLVLQGVIGDVDIIVPEEMGVMVQSSVFFGQLEVGKEKETGMLNRIIWQSPHYDTSEYRVKLFVSYFVGDIDIKVM